MRSPRVASTRRRAYHLGPVLYRSSMSEARCPICERPTAPRASNEAFPFCSPRCRTIDLGQWLGEKYAVVPASDDDPTDRPAETVD